MHPDRARTHSKRSGQSLVELALTVTFMMLLVAGAVDFGLAFFSYVALRDAAQEGALYGSFNPYIDQGSMNAKYDYGEPINEAGIRTRVRASSNKPVDFSNTTRVPDAYIKAVATTGNACEGHKLISGVNTPNGVRVTVEYDYPISMPLIGPIIGSQKIHLKAVVTDTILEPRCP